MTPGTGKRSHVRERRDPRLAQDRDELVDRSRAMTDRPDAHRPTVWTHNGWVNARVAWIHVAPIKALAIEERQRVELSKRGVPGDRQFCIVDETGKMINGKRVPTLVAIRPQLDDTKKRLALP